MAQLNLKIATDHELVVPEGVPGPLESVDIIDGIVVSQSLLLSEAFVYAFTIGVAAGVSANVATAAVKALVGRLASSNRRARFVLEEEEITLDDEGRVRRIVKTRLEGDSHH